MSIHAKKDEEKRFMSTASFSQFAFSFHTLRQAENKRMREGAREKLDTEKKERRR
jgi:hypothetical protein